MKSILQRYFYALDMDKAIESVTSSCHQCVSLLKTPKVREEQNSADPPETIGSSFAADVLKRERQLVLFLRECVTSYTFTKLLDTERHHDLRDAIIQLLAEVHPLDGPFAVIRTDPASGFKTLVKTNYCYKVAYEVSELENVQRLLPHSDDDDDERVTDISSPPPVPIIPKAISDLPTLPSVIPHQNTELENVERSLSINSPDINLSNNNCAMDIPEETCIDSQENELNFSSSDLIRRTDRKRSLPKKFNDYVMD
ncbi:unnamed protein product [Mytilus edulis]|uniref:Uncharacterized protein n=1 Tax=Mytilus edulis TaxID=6550 RepID=A0A8S3RXX2_MYTED|nr:unnamed protein product [Mytilus edulis]